MMLYRQPLGIFCSVSPEPNLPDLHILAAHLARKAELTSLHALQRHLPLCFASHPAHVITSGLRSALLRDQLYKTAKA